MEINFRDRISQNFEGSPKKDCRTVRILVQKWSISEDSLDIEWDATKNMIRVCPELLKEHLPKSVFSMWYPFHWHIGGICLMGNVMINGFKVCPIFQANPGRDSWDPSQICQETCGSSQDCRIGD